MGRIGFIVYLLILTSFSVAQEYVTIIRGKVLTDELSARPSKPIKNAKVVLVSQDGAVHESFSDSIGTYSFKIQNSFDTIILGVVTDKFTFSEGTIREEGFLDPGQLKLALNNEDTIINDFHLKKRVTGCQSPPSINFYFNSVKLINDSLSNTSGNSIVLLYRIMADNPNILVEISGHCDSREKHELSKKRADFVVSCLVEKGIPRKRLRSKGYGSAEPLVSNKVIGKARSNSEKELLHQENRRVEFKILSFDFKD